MKKINILELFSGIGGFTKGFMDAGWEVDKHYFSEVDKHAIANYKYNFPHAEYIGSVKNVRNIIRTINATRGGGVLAITFGSPCQDFSLAGKGKGLDGSKSSLIKYALFLIRWLKPDVFIWENVKGAFSTNDGADYWAIMQAFTNIPGYRHEQQLLNSSWLLPQNRERIYHVGFLPERCGPGILPIGTYYRQNPKESRETQKKIANTVSTQPAGRKQCADGTIICDKIGLRDLTEVESERLQGFPDNWTKYGDYNGVIKEIPKRQRYKLCGNAVTKDVVQAIAERLKIN